MDVKRILGLFALAAALFTLFVSTALFFLRPQPQEAAEQQQYVVRTHEGRLALYRAGEREPDAVYSVYTQLLPEQDVAALDKGIIVGTREAALRLLEDFGV